MPQESYYAMLGLKADATPSQIEAACKQMQRLYQSSGAKPERMAELKEIQAVLSDPSRRAAYNLTLKATPATSRATAAEPGLAMRWVAMLAVVLLPFGGVIWWATRPATPPGAKPAQVETKSLSPDDRIKELIHTKNMERERLVERKNYINQQISMFIAAQRKAEEDGASYAYTDSDKRETNAFKLELDWIDQRIAEIDKVEMEQAKRGVGSTVQYYQAPGA